MAQMTTTTPTKSVPVKETTREVARWEPFASPFLRWPSGRLFEDLWNAPWRQETDSLLAPALDMHETDDEVILGIELPGIKKEDVKIQIENGVLSVSGEKCEESRKETAECRRRERRYGSFYRSIALPASLNADQVDAALVDGVLEIRIPKRETAKPKVVKIH